MDIKPEQLITASKLARESSELLTDFNALIMIGGVETARLVLTRIAALESTIAQIKREACAVLPDGDSLKKEFGG